MWTSILTIKVHHKIDAMMVNQDSLTSPTSPNQQHKSIGKYDFCEMELSDKSLKKNNEMLRFIKLVIIF